MTAGKGRFSYDLARGEISFQYDARAYHREAVYGTALVMTPRCYVYLEGGRAGQARVVLESKEGADEAKLRALAGEFHNELLNQTLRWIIAKNNKRTRDAIVTQALYAARGPARRRKAAR